MNIKKLLPALVGIILAVFLTACGPVDSEEGGGSDYYDTCQQLNQEDPDMYVDPDVCASDSEQLSEDMREYGESH